ncbi:hypothetical protein FNV43_RR13300 [Rhamnella rubrinervis]|uniref:Mechanosensitive ion channel protein n=1 Tax=Rhamnella rubrinervis TaxID=2594499 RepID=A0A8K0H0T1_9ROSA|nr:hypothetical protein FNV43_RR13300 [Rhamnella rubrinervis]
MDFSLKKSFISHGSYKHMKKIAGVATDPDKDDPEELPILSDHDLGDHHHHHRSHTEPMSPVDSADRREVIVKIDDGDSSTKSVAGRRSMEQSKVWRGSSYEFWREGGRETMRTKTITVRTIFASCNGASDDVGRSAVEAHWAVLAQAEGVRRHDVGHGFGDGRAPSRPGFDTAGGVSDELWNFEGAQGFVPAHGFGRRRVGRTSCAGSDNEVLRCTSNAAFDRDVSFQKKSTLLRMKTKSRLIDPPEEPDIRAGRVPKSGQVQKSGQLRSGLLGKGLEDDEDDPFWEDDLPDDFKKANLSIKLVEIEVVEMGGLDSGSDLWAVGVRVGVRIVVFFIERNFLLRKRVLYFVYGVRKAVQNSLWLGLVLMAWHFLFDEKVERETKSDNLKYVTKVLVCFLVGTLVWLVKTLIVKVLASSFHVSKYFDRIQESLFNQYVIETLSGPPLIEIKRTEEEEERLADEVRKLQNAGATIPPDLRAAAFQSARSGRVIGSGGLQRSPKKSNRFSQALGGKKADEGITIDHLHKLNPENVSAWNMKRLMNIVRHGSLTTLDEQILDSTHDDEKATEIRSEVQAKAAAKRYFRMHIYLQDLMRFMRDDEALKTMTLFEGASESRKISKASLKNWVVNAFRERRALALTLNDTKTAVNKLHRMVNVIIGIVIAVIWLLILGIATSKFLLFVSSQLVLVAFIFGNTCKTIFEALVFLFVMHPYDVGDRCEIDGVQMVVEEMNILTTVFLRYDNTKIMYPNSVLSTKPINNYYRSPDMGDAVEYCIHVATPADKIAAIRQRVLSYVDNKKEHWYPSPMIIMKDVEDLNRVRFAVWLTHRMNYQDVGERWVRRALLVEEMAKIFRELDIQYRLLPLDINICTMPPLTSSSRLPLIGQERQAEVSEEGEFYLFDLVEMHTLCQFSIA